MGVNRSYLPLTEDELQIYEGVTGLNKAEVKHAFKKFYHIDPLAFREKRKGWIPYVRVVETFPELKNNPFRYYLGKVFCSSETGFMDFDDFIEFVAVMSDHASLDVKLHWAFKIYDTNEDGVICEEDLNVILDLITGGKIRQEEKDKVIERILGESDVDYDGALSFQEFERALTLNSKSEFKEAFRFVL